MFSGANQNQNAVVAVYKHIFLQILLHSNLIPLKSVELVLIHTAGNGRRIKTFVL